MATINAGSDGYTIYLNEAKLFVTQAQSLTSSSLGTISALGGAGVSSTIFATIGGAVGAANDSLQNGLVNRNVPALPVRQRG